MVMQWSFKPKKYVLRTYPILAGNSAQISVFVQMHADTSIVANHASAVIGVGWPHARVHVRQMPPNTADTGYGHSKDPILQILYSHQNGAGNLPQIAAAAHVSSAECQHDPFFTVPSSSSAASYSQFVRHARYEWKNLAIDHIVRPFIEEMQTALILTPPVSI